MTPGRAKEILELGSRWINYNKHMTDAEIDYVMEGWQQMPGHTCFYDALVRVAKQRWPFGESEPVKGNFNDTT